MGGRIYRATSQNLGNSACLKLRLLHTAENIATLSHFAHTARLISLIFIVFCPSMFVIIPFRIFKSHFRKTDIGKLEGRAQRRTHRGMSSGKNAIKQFRLI